MNTEKQIIKEFKRILLSSPQVEWKVKNKSDWRTWRMERAKNPYIFVEKCEAGYENFVQKYAVKIGIEYGESIWLSKWEALSLWRGVRRIKNFWINIEEQERKLLQEDILERREKELVKFLGAIKKI